MDTFLIRLAPLKWKMYKESLSTFTSKLINRDRIFIYEENGAWVLEKEGDEPWAESGIKTLKQAKLRAEEENAEALERMKELEVLSK